MGCIFVFLDCASGLSDGVKVLISEVRRKNHRVLV